MTTARGELATGESKRRSEVLRLVVGGNVQGPRQNRQRAADVTDVVVAGRAAAKNCRARRNEVRAPSNGRRRRGARAQQRHAGHRVAIRQLAQAGAEFRACEDERETVGLELIVRCDGKGPGSNGEASVMVTDGVVGQTRAHRRTGGDHIRAAEYRRRRRRACAGQCRTSHRVAVDQLSAAGCELVAREGECVAIRLGLIVRGHIQRSRIHGQLAVGKREVIVSGCQSPQRRRDRVGRSAHGACCNCRSRQARASRYA